MFLRKAIVLTHLLVATCSTSLVDSQYPLIRPAEEEKKRPVISQALYGSLEELSRITDISYCIPFVGISPPFTCPSHCADFPNFELLTTFTPVPGLDSSCTGYLAYDRHETHPRLLLAFRGTYSLGDTITDLITSHQSYVPYLGDKPDDKTPALSNSCTNCTVHSGFLASYQATRDHVVPAILKALALHPGCQLEIAGHSLGGAVALLFALEMRARGLNVTVTTYGQPAVGNLEFAKHVEERLSAVTEDGLPIYRRVTHKGDPVPGLPWQALGFSQTAGEYYVAKDNLPYAIEDIRYCPERNGTACYEGDAAKRSWLPSLLFPWDYVSAHRDYFHRLGLCLGTDTVLAAKVALEDFSSFQNTREEDL